MSKKLLPLYIYEILKDYSDSQHKLLQKDIINYIQNNYNESFERKAISRTINELISFGYDIIYENGYYLNERTFDKTELTYLIDVLLNSQTLTKNQVKNMIDKLLKNESHYTKRSIHRIHNISHISYYNNPEFFLNIELINEAIENNKQISFDYLEYGLDKKLHKKRDRKYIVNPYDLVISLNKYYLIANYDKYDNISNYRIDKISHIEILDTPIKKLDQPINLPQYSLEHLYMFSGKTIHAKLKFNNCIIDQIIDWFSTDCTIIPIDKDYSYLLVSVNETALYFWLKQYDEYVERIF